MHYDEFALRGATASRSADSDSASDQMGRWRDPDEIPLRTASSCRRVRRRILLSARRPSRDEKAKCAREQPTREVGSALVGVRGMKAPRPLAARWSHVGGRSRCAGSWCDGVELLARDLPWALWCDGPTAHGGRVRWMPLHAKGKACQCRPLRPEYRSWGSGNVPKKIAPGGRSLLRTPSDSVSPDRVG